MDIFWSSLKAVMKYLYSRCVQVLSEKGSILEGSETEIIGTSTERKVNFFKMKNHSFGSLARGFQCSHLGGGLGFHVL